MALVLIVDDDAALREGLAEARLQLLYMDERSPSGTTPAVVARVDTLLETLAKSQPGEGER